MKTNNIGLVVDIVFISLLGLREQTMQKLFVLYGSELMVIELTFLTTCIGPGPDIVIQDFIKVSPKS